jgi:hypothetical protein
VTRKGRSPAEARGITADETRGFILKLPGVKAGRSYGYPAFLVAGHFFARFRDDDEVLVVRLATLADRDVLMQMDSRAFFFTEHYRDHPSVLVRLAVVRRGVLFGVLEDALRHVSASPAAPKRARSTRTLRRSHRR